MLKVAIYDDDQFRMDPAQTLEVMCQGRPVNIPCAQIQYIESMKRLVYIRCGKYGEYVAYCKMDDLEQKLPKVFLRCHKSYIVNLNYVKELCKHEFRLYSDEIVMIAQRRLNVARNVFFQFMEEFG